MVANFEGPQEAPTRTHSWPANGEALAERFTLCHFPTASCTVDLRSHSKFPLVTFVQLLAKRVYVREVGMFASYTFARSDGVRTAPDSADNQMLSLHTRLELLNGPQRVTRSLRSVATSGISYFLTF